MDEERAQEQEGQEQEQEEQEQEQGQEQEQESRQEPVNDPDEIQDTKGDKECPECGHPVDDVRATCPECGYEYKEDDYTDPDAGADFVAGSAIDDQGEEIPDHESGN